MPDTSSLKYAHLERELRFLLPSRPRSLPVERTWRITDRYLPETGLRLRRVEEEGRPVVLKLGQKVRVDGGPRAVAHTTMYLRPAEYDTLLVLAADELAKTRHIVPLGGHRWAVDVFEGQLRGLVTAELDLGADGERPDELGLDVLADVTADERFTGGALARTSADALADLMGEHGLRA